MVYTGLNPVPSLVVLVRAAPAKGGAARRMDEGQPVLPNANISMTWSPLSRRPRCPPSRAEQQFAAGAWAVATPPGWGGRGESPQRGLATSGNPESGLRAHAVPLPARLAHLISRP